MLPGMASTITAATSAPRSSRIRSIAPRSLCGTVSVSAAAPGVTPAEPGMPRVAAPEPAATRSESE